MPVVWRRKVVVVTNMTASTSAEIVGTADQDISRTHARVALEGGTVVVTDLHSRNGTLVALPGKEPQKLRAQQDHYFGR